MVCYSMNMRDSFDNVAAVVSEFNHGTDETAAFVQIRKFRLNNLLSPL